MRRASGDWHSGLVFVNCSVCGVPDADRCPCRRVPMLTPVGAVSPQDDQEKEENVDESDASDISDNDNVANGAHS